MINEDLWPSSFRGVPFYVQKEEPKGGRRIAVHEFPMRDDPFLEDMGASKREISLSAYVVSESVIGEALALEAALQAAGPGLLVLPTSGPVLVRILSWSRALEKDSLGYIAFDVSAVAEGAGSALISLGALANGIFSAGGSLIAAASLLFSGLRLSGLPGDVTILVQDECDGLIAGLEAIRASEAIAPATSASLRDALSDLYADVPTLITRSAADATFVARLGEVARDLSAAMAPARAVAAFAALADADVPSVSTAAVTPARAAREGNARLVARVQRLVALVAYADALAATTFASRPDGVTARADASGRFALALEDCTTGADADSALAIADLRGQVTAWLSRLIADLRPVRQITANAAMPALWWAQRLYGDALRADELVARNRVRHAGFMPQRFEALAS